MNLERKQLALKGLVPLTAIFLGILAASLLIAMTRVSPLEAFGVLFNSGFSTTGRVWPLLITLAMSTPLILNGLAAMMGFRVGVFSIAQEGQYVFGAIAAAWMGASLDLPAPVFIPLVFAVSMLVGGLYSLIPGILKVKLGVNEIISSIMLNNISVLVLEYMAAFPLRADAGAKAQSAVIHQSLWLPQFVQGTRWGVAFVIALLCAVIIFILVWKTPKGYEIRMVGNAPRFARYGGINSDRVILQSLFIGGMLAGLAGSLEILGNYRRIMTGFSSGLGFDGLAVALLGGSHPLGVVIVAILLAGLRQGAQIGLQISLQIPRELGGVLIAFIILFIAAENIYRPLLERLYDRIFVKKKKEQHGKPV